MAPASQELPLVYLRDLADVEPPRDRYAYYEEEDIYRLVPRPQWTGLEDEIWTPRSQEHDPQLEKVKALMKRNAGGGSNGGDSPGGSIISATKFANKLARKKRKNPRVKVRNFLNRWQVDLFINLSIVWALFMEDIRILSIPKEADTGIWWTHVMVMILFALEFTARSYAQPVVYFAWGRGFYFWLDVLSTVTILIDFLPLIQPADSGDASATGMLRTAKTAKIGARIARLARVVRIIRVIKLFVMLKGSKKGDKEDKEEEEDEGAPSELSKALQASISKKTIVFVLLLLGVSVTVEFIPFDGMNVIYIADDRARLGMAQLFTSYAYSPTVGINDEPFLTQRQQFAAIMQMKTKLDSFLVGSTYSPLFRLDVFHFGQNGENFTFWPVPQKVETVDPENPFIGKLRGGIGEYAYGRPIPPFSNGSLGTYYEDPANYPSLYPASDPMSTWTPTWPYPDNAWPNCQIDSLNPLYADAAARYLQCPATADMRRLRLKGNPEVLRIPFIPGPRLANLIGRPDLADETVLELWYSTREKEQVQALFSILLLLCIMILLGVMGYLLSKDVDGMVIRPIESMVSDVTKLAANPAYKLESPEKVVYETDALRLSLAKIATMLQVGFGEAGNNLVAENLKKGDTVDPMVPGRKLLGAYGFCIIDEYEEVLECLGEEILPFTNTAAQIVHDAVRENGGQPNRNLGEAFLCVWKPDYTHGAVAQPEGTDDGAHLTEAELALAESKMCDGALTSFRRCVRGIAMSAKLQGYNEHDEIVKFFDGHYTTRIGYGLHYGWAIEGAVGTNIKIDCSYLSPNVNLAARLESATKMYGVNVLMSESFHDKLSPAVQQGLRRVDVVCLKGSSIPMAIYTCDRSNALWVSQKAIEKHGAEAVIGKFQSIFEEGMDEFVQGNWQASKTLFEQALQICPRDKPSQRILMHMDTPEAHPDYGLATKAFEAPEGWPGYHILLSK